MSTKEEISMIAFSIVAYAGDAKAAVLKALSTARDGKFDEARELLDEANESIVLSHREQTKLLSEEAGGVDLNFSMIMIHAQDSLMTTMMLKEESEYFIDVYERLHALENK